MFRRSEEGNQGQGTETQEALNLFFFSLGVKRHVNIFWLFALDRFSKGWALIGSPTILIDVAIVLTLLPFQQLHQKIILAYRDSFPFPFQRLACSSQAVSHSETLRFYFLESFFPLRTTGLFFPNPVSLVVPPWARDFPGATDLRVGFCKVKLCLWLQCHCQKGISGDHRSEWYWLHEIPLAKQEDVICSGFAAVSRGSNKKEMEKLSFQLVLSYLPLSNPQLYVMLLLCWCSWLSPGCA